MKSLLMRKHDRQYDLTIRKWMQRASNAMLESEVLPQLDRDQHGRAFGNFLEITIYHRPPLKGFPFIIKGYIGILGLDERSLQPSQRHKDDVTS